jgi:protein ImuB
VVPEYRAARFTALLAARLESLLLRQPVSRIELMAGRLRRFIATSSVLWAPGEHGGEAAVAQAAPEFLQTLMARLGDEAVHGLATVDEHRPERQQQRVPAVLTPLKTAGGADWGSAQAHAPRPLGLLSEPLPLEVFCDAAGHVRQLRHEGRDLSLVSGPERIESGWWDGADVRRDYYVARTPDGAQWWIFRDGDASRNWFVHGCFA